MSVTVHVNMAPVVFILKNLGMEYGGPAQRFMSAEMARLMDPYVPKRDGYLKNSRTIGADFVRYEMPYARRQYYENAGEGMRGKQWDKRMLTDRADDLVQSVAAYIRG